MEVFLILDFPLKIPCLARFLFWIYHRKWSWPIRLQDSWKFNISTKMRDQGNFLFTDKHQSFLQVGAIPFGRWGQLFPKYPKWQVSNIFVIFQERREGQMWFFCMKINITIFYKLAVLFLLIMTRHAQSIQNSKFVIS